MRPVSAVRLCRCPHCEHSNRVGEPFCFRCGIKLLREPSLLSTCRSCGTLKTDETARYCAGCGEYLVDDVAAASETFPRGVQLGVGLPRLSVLDASGDVSRVIPLPSPRATLSADELGLQVGQHLLGGDGATLSVADRGARLEPVGSPRALFVFVTEETRLSDGEILLLGAQVIRCRRLVDDGSTYFGDAAAAQLGSIVPGPDVVVLEQLRADGRVRDTIYLWRNRVILVGREEGDWLFPYDRTMSARHAVIACREDGSITVKDLGSRNGVALAVREGRDLVHGQRVSLGGQVMRVELA